jgi:hypothetical protein
MVRSGRSASCAVAAAVVLLTQPNLALAQTPAPLPPQDQDGGHGFDFLIGSWKVHLRKLANPLTGSAEWVQYDGTSVTHKVLGSNANLEEFKVDGAAPDLHIHAQTLRLYNPQSRQWSIYLLDVNKGTLGLPATVGAFIDGRGEFFDQEEWKGRWIQVRYQWTHEGGASALMQQSFSTDGGKTWEVNWICEMTRVGA